MKRLLMHVKRFVGNEKGSVVVIVALGFAVFMGVVAIVSDVGLLYINQNKLAHALDAAALAGVQELPDDPNNAVDVAKSYAQLNGVDPNQVNVTVSGDKKELTVESTENINLIFAKLFGKETGSVAATATAKVAPAKAVTEAVPFSIPKQELYYGEEYVLKEDADVTREGLRWTSWFGILDFTGGGGGASEYREMVKDGYQEKVSIGDVIFTEQGNKAGPSIQGARDRIDSCNHYPQCTWDNFMPDCPRVIYVPVVEPLEWQGGHPYKVKVEGFAAFFLKDIEEDAGNNQSIIGHFIRETISAEIDESLTNYGLQGVKLTE